LRESCNFAKAKIGCASEIKMNMFFCTSLGLHYLCRIEFINEVIMQTAIQNFNLVVPESDVRFFRALSKKMGWTLKKNATVKEETHSPLYYELQSAFRDVKLMVDGKKPKKSLDELIYELRNTND
jgi:hypothetical protein